jgi:uncharacterized protein (TIGR02246 family)
MTMSSTQGIQVLVARLLDALKRHDAAACAALFTQDAVILSPYGPPAKGQVAIATIHQSWFDEGEKEKKLELLDAGCADDVGYCVLAYSGAYARPDGSYEHHCGRSVNVLHKEADGDWRIHISSMTVEDDQGT